jgi:hypothetical protein
MGPNTCQKMFSAKNTGKKSAKSKKYKYAYLFAYNFLPEKFVGPISTNLESA